MPLFRGEFKYKVEEFGEVELPATNVEDAKAQLADYIKDVYSDAIDVEITEVKEIND